MNLTSTSKYLSLILRHKPEAAGITLDEHGWADVQALIPVISIRGLIDMKRSLGREKDARDVELIEKYLETHR